MTDVVERFINYVKFDTKSDEDSKTVPSTRGQFEFAKLLGDELNKLGLKDVSVDENGYVMATLPANIDQKVPVVGFIAHMDTSPSVSGKNVNPQIIKNYNGEDIILNKEQNIVLSTEVFPEIKEYVGEDLITTDGTTLLGADDKAGVAEIVTAVEQLINSPEIKHGEIKIGFTPDEEIGRGADHFDVDKFNADFAFTVDGGPIGELEYENFNAAAAHIIINGVNVHPGTAKDKMKNSMLIAGELINLLPETETPARTEGYEGFYHLVNMKGDVEQTKLYYIIRDFEKNNFEKRKEFMEQIKNKLNQRYGENTVELELKDQYYNMKEKIEEKEEIVELAQNAMTEVGIKPDTSPIRGGTDGARLSYMGLPTPNIFTGGHNYHGKYEYIPVSSMKKAVDVVMKIVELNALS